MTDGATPAPIPSRAQSVAAGWNAGWGGGSGRQVARLLHRGLAAIWLVAWLSLAVQVRLLIGSRGLLPLADFVDAARSEGALSMINFPSLLALHPSDGTLWAGTLLGIGLALLGISGVRPRSCAAGQTVLYLGYVTACRGFLGFQWDNLLLECGLLAMFLPTDRPARITHLLFRALLFKLYFESGIAKWQSPLHDWQDGSAMTFYYETAPLPTALAWYAHHLPTWWHQFESRATLAVELVLPFAIFGPRRARLGAAAVFTGFQILNAATANYGFFCYLSLALHVFLLDDGDVHRLGCRVGRWLAPAVLRLSSLGRIIRRRVPAVVAAALSRFGAHGAAMPTTPSRPRLRRALASTGVAAWVLVSLTEALFHFGDPGPAARALIPVLQLSQSFRLVNTFHLFAAVTRERIEPEVQIQTDGVWAAHHLRYKPGDPAHAPRFVAPHQPRVDFLLWFHGLAYQRGQPAYVAELLARLCEDPTVVASLFPMPLPIAPQAVRMVYWTYHFTSPGERRATGAWWRRDELGSTRPLACAR